LTPDVGPRTARALLARVVPPALAQTLAAPPEPSIAHAINFAEAWLAAGDEHALVTLADAEYPRALVATHDPPPLL